jgi:hypothetical protein
VVTCLISSMPPGAGGVGEILIDEMLRCAGIGQVVFAGLMTEAHFLTADRTWLSNSECFVPPHEFAKRSAPGFKGTVLTIVDRLRRYEPEVRQLAHRILDFVNAQCPDQIWIILNSTAAIDVASIVAERTRIPILVHVWDDCEHILMQRRLDRLTRHRTLQRLQQLLARATRIGVICEQMADGYAQKSSAPCIVIRHGLQDVVTPSEEVSSNDEFRIGLSGSMYCYSAWNAFQFALDRLDWQINNKKIVLVVAGQEIQFRAFKPAECRFYGWRSASELSELLTSCDVLYVPQPFDPLQEPLARLSFPTKLSTYVATGRPVFLHAPKYGSLTSFSKYYEFGLLSHSLDPVELSEQLRESFSNQEVLRSQSRASARVGSTVLGRSEFERRTREFLAPQLDQFMPVSRGAIAPVV